MSAGHLVFPVVIVGFLAFMGTVLIGTPAAPPPPAIDADGAASVVQPGDRVTLELTAYYGSAGAGHVFFTTQEERASTLPRGRIDPSYQVSPISIQVPAQGAGPLDLPTLLLGKKVGDRYTTPIIPADDAFGDWERQLSIRRVLATLPVEVRHDSTTIINGRMFNASLYVEHWRREGVDLRPGTDWPCENDDLWWCRLVEVDEGRNVLRYQRLVANGQTLPMSSLVAGVQVTGSFGWNVTVVVAPDGTSFGLRADPPVGTRFQLREPLTQELQSGTYEVLELDATFFRTNFTTADNTNADLVGEDIYYDIVIVRIAR